MKTTPTGDHADPSLPLCAEWAGTSGLTCGENPQSRTSSFRVQPTAWLATATVLVYLLLSASFPTSQASASPTYPFWCHRRA